MDDNITYKDLRIVHQSEKKNPNLIEIEPDFYIKAKKYIKMLENALTTEEENEHKKKLVVDELKSAKQILLSIYELREKKIILAALSKIRGGKPDTRHFLEDEKSLFNEIVDSLMKYRKVVLEEKEEDKDVVMKTEKKKASIALIKDDIPTFIGPDMKKYNLRKGDIISLSDEIFKVLEKRGAAERVI